MSDEQRVTDKRFKELVHFAQGHEKHLLGTSAERELLALDLHDERTAHRATEAKLQAALAEVERLKADAPKVSDADWNDASDEQKRQYLNLTMRTCNAHFEQAMSNGASANKQRARADAAESALAATKAKLEAAEAVVNAAEHSRPLIHALAEWERSHGSLLAGVLVADVPSLFAAINGVNARGNSFRQLDVAIAALTTKEAPDER